MDYLRVDFFDSLSLKAARNDCKPSVCVVSVVDGSDVLSTAVAKVQLHEQVFGIYPYNAMSRIV